MHDLREVENVDEWLTRFAPFRGAVFVWKQWDRPHEGWTHDHCWSCFACVCDHRERFPEWKQAHEERGCYRHAYYTELKPGVYLWVCRTCFKRLKSEMNWAVASPDPVV
jgi:hypothetical protein